MKFLGMTIEHFKTFRAKQELPLADLGLVLIQGRNDISVSADSNGVGKTALIEALSWVLFGQTLRGERADEVACRFTKDQCVVSLWASSNGDQYRITRTRRPAWLTLHKLKADSGEWINVSDDTKEVQANIDQMLGFGFRTFCNAVVFGQGNFDRFALADQHQRMQMLDEIQGISFKAPLEKAKAWRNQWDDAHQENIRKAEHVRIQLHSIQDQIAQLETARRSFESAKTERVEQAVGGVCNARGALDALMDKSATFTETKKQAEKIRCVFDEIEQLRAEVLLLQQGCAAADKDSTAAWQALEDKTTSVDRLIKQKRCPTCRQPTDTTAKAIQKSFDEDIRKLRMEVQMRERAAKQASDLHKEKLDRLGKLEKGHEGIDVLVRDLEQKTSDSVQAVMQGQLKDAQVALCDAEEALSRERSRVWDSEPVLDKLVRDKSHLDEEQGAINRETVKAENTLRVASYWVEAFGDRGLRSLLFDALAGFISERLAIHLETLTGGEATVAMSALKTTKTGRAREQISMDVDWSFGAQSYVGGSAGQDRRIDLALFCALQDLAEYRSAKGFPIRIWDEAVDALDARGREIFCRWVSLDARGRGTGFLITHSQELAEMVDVDAVWTVILDKHGSRVEVT